MGKARQATQSSKADVIVKNRVPDTKKVPEEKNSRKIEVVKVKG